MGSDTERMPNVQRQPPLQGVLGFGNPGDDIELYDGYARLGGAPVGRTRIWTSMQRGLKVMWRALDAPEGSVDIGRTCLSIEHPHLGRVEMPADVNQGCGWGTSPHASLGDEAGVDRVVVHWLNLPVIHPAGVLTSGGSSWAGRWEVEACGWRFRMDSRPDHPDALLLANETDEQYLITHVGELRRSDGALFNTAAATEALLGWQLALSFALGRWVAPALPVGFEQHGRRIWELWAPWRCDTVRGYESWWDTHTGDDLKAFVISYLRKYLDPDEHDKVRMAAMHVITANHRHDRRAGRSHPLGGGHGHAGILPGVRQSSQAMSSTRGLRVPSTVATIGSRLLTGGGRVS